MKIEELAGKTIVFKSDPEQRYKVAGVNPKFDFGSQRGSDAAVTLVRELHGTGSVVPGATVLAEFELVDAGVMRDA